MLLSCLCALVLTTGPAQLEVLAPRPYQVVQREGFDPIRAHEHEPGGPALGFADVQVEFALPESAAELGGEVVYEYRAVSRKDEAIDVPWAATNVKAEERRRSATVRIPGGWYRLELRARREAEILAMGQVDPFGVGEVLVVAGQSYAVGANDELTKVDDPQGRVVAYDVLNRRWQVAHDPQPNAGDGGTIWPTTGNLLLPLTRVPIGFVNVAVGGTSTRQWQPGETLFNNLATAGKQVGRFRAVLWQQGESDVIEHRTTEYYVQNMIRMRDALRKEWGFDPPWLLAKSTLHPTVYNDPEGEGRIRAAIDELWRTPGVRPGPDTDILGSENRGGPTTRRHFSGIGQRRAGLMWFAAIWQELNRLP